MNRGLYCARIRDPSCKIVLVFRLFNSITPFILTITIGIYNILWSTVLLQSGEAQHRTLGRLFSMFLQYVMSQPYLQQDKYIPFH